MKEQGLSVFAGLQSAQPTLRVPSEDLSLSPVSRVRSLPVG